MLLKNVGTGFTNACLLSFMVGIDYKSKFQVMLRLSRGATLELEDGILWLILDGSSSRTNAFKWGG